MNCTAAPRLEATAPDSESTYALEGTLAHAYCALKLKEFLYQDTTAEREEIAELNDRYHTGEMDEYTDTYKTIVLEKFNAARTETSDAELMVETRLDFSEYVPEAFGTSDATIIADGTMEVIDFKYGKGVRVSAVRNEQMMIYALGAYLRHSFEYRIERVRMTIVQPRIDNLSEYELTVEELMKWAHDELRPKAVVAAVPGDAEVVKEHPAGGILPGESAAHQVLPVEEAPGVVLPGLTGPLHCPERFELRGGEGVVQIPDIEACHFLSAQQSHFHG